MCVLIIYIQWERLTVCSLYFCLKGPMWKKAYRSKSLVVFTVYWKTKFHKTSVFPPIFPNYFLEHNRVSIRPVFLFVFSFCMKKMEWIHRKCEEKKTIHQLFISTPPSANNHITVVDGHTWISFADLLETWLKLALHLDLEIWPLSLFYQ